MRFSFSNPVRFCGLLLVLLCLTVFAVHGQTAGAAPQTDPAHVAGGSQSADAPGPSAKTGELHAGKGAAAGNGSSSTGNAEGLLVAEVVLLLLVGRILGEGMQRLGQPALMGNLLAGLVLGPSLFGVIWPEAQKFLFPSDPAQKAMIDGLSQIGILFLLLLTGMETDRRAHV